MKGKLSRVGTTYLPVKDVEESTTWYAEHLGAKVNYKDNDKAILQFADQSFFLVKSPLGESANFTDSYGNECFSVTFEVNGVEALANLHQDFKGRDINVGKIEDRGHAGRNFVFYDPNGNKFDVWSELSPTFRALHHQK